ncbi:GPR1/FUN34/yaaH family-domain-containing protein [Mycena rosella]|uniref:GPR1/FUN34/yaaH family-domain-containing protein n=1 Tax=Mycena rosella TaxID=1033263 RepID=A0AAD7C6N9_MYCRO|nr:GPR1/FUN34/yaaH family-domain-containing protein [Mycena rosella]
MAQHIDSTRAAGTNASSSNPGACRGANTPRQLGNPTAFAIISYLLALTPTVVGLMRWDGAAPASLTGIIGVFYFIGGMGMTLGGVFEWVLGNTFPFIVFSSFGGFWLSLGVLFDPSKQIASAFPDGGTASPEFNHGVQFYFTSGPSSACSTSSRPSALTSYLNGQYIFATLVFTFSFLAAGYRQAALGNAALSLTFLRTAGAFGFVRPSFILPFPSYHAQLTFNTGKHRRGVVPRRGARLAAVEMPWALPVGDLSGWGRLRRKVE